MKDSNVTVEKQKTPLGGYPEEVWLETRDNLEVQTGEAASKNGNDDVQLIYTKQAACGNPFSLPLDIQQ